MKQLSYIDKCSYWRDMVMGEEEIIEWKSTTRGCLKHVSSSAAAKGVIHDLFSVFYGNCELIYNQWFTCLKSRGSSQFENHLYHARRPRWHVERLSFKLCYMGETTKYILNAGLIERWKRDWGKEEEHDLLKRRVKFSTISWK